LKIQARLEALLGLREPAYFTHAHLGLKKLT